MIVKVQLSLFTSAGVPQVLIYNQARTVVFEGDADDEIVRRMGDDVRAFFKAKLHGTLIHLGAKLDEQGW
jgi:hypothetical protein